MPVDSDRQLDLHSQPLPENPLFLNALKNNGLPNLLFKLSSVFKIQNIHRDEIYFSFHVFGNH
jgi:hypothetical protein